MKRRLLSLRGLQALEAVIRHGAFVRAAEELHVTPAAISQQIKLLEEQIGHALFQRGSNLNPTAIATDAFAQLRDGLDLLERASNQLRGNEAHRPLVVSTPPSFASRWLIPRLGDFQACYPDIELRLQATTRLVDFKVEDVDVAIRYGDGVYPGLHVERLRAETLIAAAHPRIASKMREPADLLQATLLRDAYMSRDATFPDWSSWLHNLGVNVAQPLTIREFSDANLVIEAALAGLGVVLTWRTLLADEFAAGRLQPLFAEQSVSKGYHLVCPPQNLALVRVIAFGQWLKNAVAVDTV